MKKETGESEENDKKKKKNTNAITRKENQIWNYCL